jgi:hypothetical protein
MKMVIMRSAEDFFWPNSITTINRLLRRTLARSYFD